MEYTFVGHRKTGDHLFRIPVWLLGICIWLVVHWKATRRELHGVYRMFGMLFHPQCSYCSWNPNQKLLRFTIVLYASCINNFLRFPFYSNSFYDCRVVDTIQANYSYFSDFPWSRGRAAVFIRHLQPRESRQFCNRRRMMIHRNERRSDIRNSLSYLYGICFAK